MVNSPDLVMQELASFYESLYCSGVVYAPDDLDQYLHNMSFPELTMGQRKGLEATLTLEELQEAVSSFHNCKAPGKDGIPIEIYKQYSAILLPRLLHVFNGALECGALPPSMSKANIVLLLKPGKDPVDPGSYRPISLLQATSRSWQRCWQCD